MAYRDLGFVDLFQQFVPESLAFPVALLTQLGAIWFAIAIIVLVFRYHDRENAIVIAGLLIAGTAVWRFIKEVYVVPRPSQPFVAADSFPFVLEQVFDIAVVQAGPGFPSGHAVTTTVLYFSIATYLHTGNRPIRYGIATLLVALVGFTRITLGVHYITDVVAGALIGHTLLFLFFTVSRHTTWDRVDIAFAGGISLAAISLFANLVIAPVNPRDVVIFVAAIGTYLAWRNWLDDESVASVIPPGVGPEDDVSGQ